MPLQRGGDPRHSAPPDACPASSSSPISFVRYRVMTRPKSEAGSYSLGATDLFAPSLRLMSPANSVKKFSSAP